ncbi:MAG: response regulator [Candidatus Omnitrophota bacterium]|nr:response regulator [Candidatus Omnitrophota bacterium]
MSGKKHIIIIDNDKTFTALIKKFLEDKCSFDVKVVPDGYNGIITAKKTPPDLIILDVRMPAMNGLEILKKLKSENETASIPVIVFTGFNDDEIRDKAFALKAADYLVKPLDLEVLCERITAALKN